MPLLYLTYMRDAFKGEGRDETDISHQLLIESYIHNAYRQVKGRYRAQDPTFYG